MVVLFVYYQYTAPLDRTIIVWGCEAADALTVSQGACDENKKIILNMLSVKMFSLRLN